MDVLDSPVPALVGVQAPFDSLDYAFDGVVVLDLDARNGLVRLGSKGGCDTEHLLLVKVIVGGSKGSWRFYGRCPSCSPRGGLCFDAESNKCW